MNILLFNSSHNRKVKALEQAYRARVLADGGIIQDSDYIARFYDWSLRNFPTLPRHATSDLAGVKLNNVAGVDYVQVCYNLNPDFPDLVQATATNQPLYDTDSDTGFRVKRFDGSNDFMSSTDLAIFRNQGVGTLYAVAKDTNRTGGDVAHNVISISSNVVSTRIGINTRGASNSFIIVGRRLDGESQVFRTVSSQDGFSSLVCVANWSGNSLIGVFNGTATAAIGFNGGAGNTSDTNSLQFNIGAIAANSDRIPGIIPVTLADRRLYTSQQIASINALHRIYFPTLPI